MSIKVKSMRYIFVSVILLCCTVAVQAQERLTSSKIIMSSDYKEVGDKLKFVGTEGAVHVLSKENLDAKVVVDKSKNRISIDLIGQGMSVQNMEQDVVVINIDGVTILTKSGDIPADAQSTYIATTTDGAPSTEPSDVLSEEGSVKPKSSSRIVEMSASIRGGLLFYDKTVTVMGASIRNTIRLKSVVRLGLALSTDAYTFFPDTSLDSGEFTMYMLTTALACDLSLWDRDKPSILPSRLTIDVGAGFGLNNTEAQGLAFSPGLMWYVAGAEGKAKLCLSLNYKYQRFSEENFGSGMMLGLGYKF